MVNRALIRVPSVLTVTPETVIPLGVTFTVGLAPKLEPEMATAEMPPACPVFGTMMVIVGVTEPLPLVNVGTCGHEHCPEKEQHCVPVGSLGPLTLVV
jgi:hypothetical protein